MDIEAIANTLQEIHDGWKRTADAKKENERLARQWITGEAMKTLQELVAALDKAKGVVERAKCDPGDQRGLKRTLTFSYLPTISSMSYIIHLEVSSEGVTGRTELLTRTGSKSGKPYGEDHKDILTWTKEDIVKDFSKGYGSWQPEKEPTGEGYYHSDPYLSR